MLPVISFVSCGLVKPNSSKKCNKEPGETVQLRERSTSPPRLAPGPTQRRRRNAWVYKRRASMSPKPSSNKSPASSSKSTTPLKDTSSASTWSSYRKAQKVAMRDEEERELREVAERERLVRESEERERELRAKRRIKGQRDSREVEEWFKRLMVQW